MNRKIANLGKHFFCFALGSTVACCYEKRKKQGNKIDDKDKKARQLFDNWLVLAERETKIEEYFHQKKIQKVAVYGYADIGNHLTVQLADTDIEVRYVIDKRPCSPPEGIAWYRPTDELPYVDAVIITPVWEYTQIKETIRRKVSGQILSMEDIVYELL